MFNFNLLVIISRGLIHSLRCRLCIKLRYVLFDSIDRQPQSEKMLSGSCSALALRGNRHHFPCLTYFFPSQFFLLVLGCHLSWFCSFGSFHKWKLKTTWKQVRTNRYLVVVSVTDPQTSQGIHSHVPVLFPCLCHFCFVTNQLFATCCFWDSVV